VRFKTLLGRDYPQTGRRGLTRVPGSDIRITGRSAERLESPTTFSTSMRGASPIRRALIPAGRQLSPIDNPLVSGRPETVVGLRYFTRYDRPRTCGASGTRGPCFDGPAMIAEQI